MKKDILLLLKFSLVYFLIAFYLYSIAPEQCRGWLCFNSKEWVKLIAIANYGFIMTTISLRHILLKIWKQKVQKPRNEIKKESYGVVAQVHFLLAAIISPIGAFYFMIFIDQFYRPIRDIVYNICLQSRQCEDFVGSAGLWFIGTMVSFSVLFYMVRLTYKFIARKLFKVS